MTAACVAYLLLLGSPPRRPAVLVVGHAIASTVGSCPGAVGLDREGSSSGLLRVPGGGDRGRERLPAARVMGTEGVMAAIASTARGCRAARTPQPATSRISESSRRKMNWYGSLGMTRAPSPCPRGHPHRPEVAQQPGWVAAVSVTYSPPREAPPRASVDSPAAARCAREVRTTMTATPCGCSSAIRSARVDWRRGAERQQPIDRPVASGTGHRHLQATPSIAGCQRSAVREVEPDRIRAPSRCAKCAPSDAAAQVDEHGAACRSRRSSASGGARPLADVRASGNRLRRISIDR
jgi:hypothetical protein